MAEPGTFTAWNSLKPLQGDLANDVRTQEDMDFKYRQEQRVEDAIDQARKDKIQANKEKIWNDTLSKIPKNYDTGSASLNSMQAGVIQQGVNRLGEIATQLQKDNLSEKERIDLMIERQNIENLPDNLKVATDKFSGIINDYQKGIADGSYFRNEKFESHALNGFDNYLAAIDKNGLPVLAFRDTNNDGKVDINDIQTYDNLSQGIPTFEFQKQYDLDKMAVETAKTLGSSDITSDNNYLSVQTKQANMDALNKIANNLFTNPDGTATPVALSQMRKMNLSNDAEGLQKAKDYYIQRVLADKDYTRKEDFDYGARNADSQEARLRAKEAKEQSAATGEPVTPSQGTWDKQFNSIDPQRNLSVPLTGKVMLSNLRVSDGRNLSNVNIENYTYNKDGKLVVDISYDAPKTVNKVEGLEDSETTTTSEKRKEQVIVTPETEARISKILGIKKRDMRNLSYVNGWDSSKPDQPVKKATIPGW